MIPRPAVVLPAVLCALAACSSAGHVPALGAASDPAASVAPISSGVGALASSFDPETIAPAGAADPHAHHRHGQSMPAPAASGAPAPAPSMDPSPHDHAQHEGAP